MRISIFGIGYVGCVSAACFARAGHDVIGVDVNPTKVNIVNSGSSPIVEPEINELIRDVVKVGKLSATTDPSRAINFSDISLVCVGTPSKHNGSLDLSHVRRVCEEIGSALAHKSERHTVVIRSTMLPGSIESVVQPAMEKTSRKKAGKDFGLCVNPEFLREGTSLKDFNAPPFTLIGTDDEQTAKIVGRLYSDIDAPIFTTSMKTAEMVKYVSNCFHALKVSFANEIGNVCKALQLDSHEVMNVFCADSKLNLSSYYLKPGFAFGGSCLPKDLRALTYKAKDLDVEVPVLSARLVGSNREYIEQEIPHIAKLMRSSIDDVLGAANTIVIGNKSEEFRQIELRLRKDQTVIDLVRLFDRTSGEGYQGICW